MATISLRRGGSAIIWRGERRSGRIAAGTLAARPRSSADRAARLQLHGRGFHSSRGRRSFECVVRKAGFSMTDSAGSVREHAATPAPWTGIAAGVALIVAFRIPAFLEPRWYSDASTYAYVGRPV